MKKTNLFTFIALFVSNHLALGQQNQGILSPSNGFVANMDCCQTIDHYLLQIEHDKNFSGGLLIIKDGIKIFSKAYGWANKEKKTPFTPNTLASMGSITKAFTATAILKLCEQGKLSLNDSLKHFFPNCPSDKSGVTVHQLLTHSAGFHEFLKDDGGDYAKLEQPEFLLRAFNEPLSFKPGEKAIYTNVGMSILSVIIEQVSGMEYEAFLKKELFEPVEIHRIGYYSPPAPTEESIAHGYQNGQDWGTIQRHFIDAGGGPYYNLKGNGGLEASLEDMFLWSNAIRDNKVLSAMSLRKMFTPHVVEEGYNGKSFFGYGCNISTTKRNTTMISNGGSNGIYFARWVRLPEEGLIFYMVTNESTINTNMVLPNVTQLYFQGKIEQDATTIQAQFDSPLAKKIADIVEMPTTTDLETTLTKEKIVVEDDMVLLDVGQSLIRQSKWEKALMLYRYYTKSYPNIVVAWNDMGDIYRMQSNKPEAKKCYQEALKLRPQNPRAKENLSKLGD